MFALILVMTFNSVTHQATYAIGPEGFQTQVSCETYAKSDAGQKYMRKIGAVGFHCDTLKKDR